MTLQWFFVTCLKARIKSWLDECEIGVFITMTSMEQLVIARFSNGKRVKTQGGIPDQVPPEWTGQDEGA
jgi:hypothetical protein